MFLLRKITITVDISIHALLAESDLFTMTTTICIAQFLSTLSLRRATANSRKEQQEQHISIHALLAESDGVHYDNYNLHCTISIHALLAESDVWMGGLSFNDGNFYPRSPCGERRKVRNPSRPGKINFYPRSPCGERLDSSRAANCQQHFYPRSPCGERRTDHIKRNKKVKFLSTLSLRRATQVAHQ